MTCRGCDTCGFDQKPAKGTPYEIHVTVSPGSVERFKNACCALLVKPLLIDMQTAGEDLMTSSTHVGNDLSVFMELTRIANGIGVLGFRVIRSKIEAAPWHHNAPTDSNGKKLHPGQYFESHLAVRHFLTDRADVEAIAKANGAHLSKNAFKNEGEQCVTMATLRNYGTYEDIVAEALIAKTMFREAGHQVDKTIIEFALYDSNVAHDSKWIAANDNQPVSQAA